MSINYQDYYKTLGVERSASQDEVQKAFRKLARKFHPDVSKEKGAEEQFKLINEAYEVLGDPEKRKLYDSLGSNWKAGQDFRPPPGFEEMFGRGHGGAQSRGPAGMQFQFGGGAGDAGGFSDFFSAIFGGLGGAAGFGGAQNIFSQGGAPGMEDLFGGRSSHRPQSFTAELSISIEDAWSSNTKQVTLSMPCDREGRRTYAVKIPPGTKEGSTIRLAAQGSGTAEILFKVHFTPDARYSADGFDIVSRVDLAPWEACLGARVKLATPGGELMLNVPAGSQAGQRLRLKGRGLPKSRELRGDMFAELRITVPTILGDKERALFEELASTSSFKPRGN